MTKLEERIEYVKWNLKETKYNILSHIHCKKCAKMIYGKLEGENETDVERKNPFFKYQTCLECGKKLALDLLGKNKMETEIKEV
ncbi:hypothetical protein LCGC14_1716300 [marine sediment metagenome]|uniref:Uncharacterized protein n=1 Tax=marine sediment metagenome TaxID=412755 RepID=A0A0F9JU56_9ZZZZ